MTDALRLVDANLNRLREGLRVLEDIARLYLDDGDLCRQLKDLRHELTPRDEAVEGTLLAARRAGDDVGAFLPQEAEGRRRSLAQVARANARRAQESLRLLEEMAKLPSFPWPAPSDMFKRARFSLYQIEQRLALSLGRRERRQRVGGLYLILDTPSLGDRDAEEVAQAALAGGARMLQLRDKATPKGLLLPLAQRLQELCQAHDALFLVNDHPDLALAAGADGVHLGQKDLPTALARRILPPDRLVGRSTATLEEALQAQEEGADYIAVGSIFPTPSKQDARPAGLEVLRQVRQAVSVPVIAIGGIGPDNIARVKEAGAQGAAVLSAVLGARDVAAAARALVQAFGGEN